MSHDIHQGANRVLDDDCEECLYRLQNIGGLSTLDPESLATLGALAQEIHERRAAGESRKPDDASWADLKAVELLRQAARLTYRAGISEEVAQ